MQTFKGRARNLSTDGSAVVESLEDGRVFFVEGAWPGDEGTFEILSFEKRFGYAKLLQLEKSSEDRTDVSCEYQGYSGDRCGGCPWMIGTYASQLRHKMARVEFALRRANLLGGGHVEKVEEIVGSDLTRGYRNRAQFKSDGKILGFVGLSTTELVDVKSCEVLNPQMQKNLDALRSSLPNDLWRPSGEFYWNFLDVDDESDVSSPRELSANVRRPFKQGNRAQNEKMKEWLRSKVSGQNVLKTLELFCGSGNFTEILAEHSASDLLAVELAQRSLDDLQKKSTSWKYPKSSHRLQTLAFNLSSPRDFTMFVSKLKGARKIDFDLLFLDPPREGAKGVELLVKEARQLKRILMVSCDVATFTRDAAAICKIGYSLKEVRPLDLFPHTAHVEVLSEFVKK
jgi:23S rRNA (uracil1939-C5)-methyltransferase